MRLVDLDAKKPYILDGKYPVDKAPDFSRPSELNCHRAIPVCAKLLTARQVGTKAKQWVGLV